MGRDRTEDHATGDLKHSLEIGEKLRQVIVKDISKAMSDLNDSTALEVRNRRDQIENPLRVSLTVLSSNLHEGTAVILSAYFALIPPESWANGVSRIVDRAMEVANSTNKLLDILKDDLR